MTRFFYGCAHEQFDPRTLLGHAVAAEDAGFDGIACSDHFQPWWEPGESGQAWIWLGALGQATRRVPIGTAVTPAMQRYHPALVAQAFATLEIMNPGRASLGIWKGAGPPEFYVDDWHEPARMYEHAEKTIDDDRFRKLQIISADPDEHAARVRSVERLGATTVALMNISGADPHAAIETYRRHVLPAVRGQGA